ncbi:hypothetical protein ABKV19_000345 [Rosa sericea]
MFIAALTYLNPFGDNFVEDDSETKRRPQLTEGIDMQVRNAEGTSHGQAKPGMVWPFQPLSLAFSHVNYYVDMPAEMKTQGIEENRLQLLRDVNGAFRPGILTALVGVSGAGKTALMDVLAERKTGGYIEGSISVSRYPKNQTTFARVIGYCEHNDIHSIIHHMLLFMNHCYTLPGYVFLRMSTKANERCLLMKFWTWWSLTP